MSNQQPPPPPPGWYPDGRGTEWRWDGSRWTGERRPVGPPAPAEPPPPLAGEPTRIRPRPVPPPGQVPSPDQVPTVMPGAWPAQPVQPAAPAPTPTPAAPAPPPPAPPPVRPPTQPPPPAPRQPGWPAASYSSGPVGPSPFGPGITPPPRRSLRWLWITLAVLLVIAVGVATTLLVIRPWEGDASTADDTGSSEPADGDAAEEPEAPGDPSDTAADPAPVSEPVTGDIDGDGHGDAVAVFQGRSSGPITRITLSSDGSSFASSQEELETFEDRTWADFDGDGTLDEVAWAVDGSDTLTLTSADLSFRELNFPVRLDADAPYVNLKPGDFDGDGAVDVVAYGATGPTTVAVWMLRNNGAGFDEPQDWLTIRDTKFFSTSLYPADFTGDGRTDLGALLPAGRVRGNEPFYTGELGVAMLTSTGSRFEQGPLDRPAPDLDAATLVVGDFTGDGTPLVLGLSSTGSRIEVAGYEWNGARFTEVRSWRGEVSASRGFYLASAVVTDADGDGLDDVVYATYRSQGREYDGFRVARSTGRSLEPSTVWARTPRCGGDACFLYFQNGS